jgi:hypothetical protein
MPSRNIQAALMEAIYGPMIPPNSGKSTSPEDFEAFRSTVNPETFFAGQIAAGTPFAVIYGGPSNPEEFADALNVPAFLRSWEDVNNLMETMQATVEAMGGIFSRPFPHFATFTYSQNGTTQTRYIIVSIILGIRSASLPIPTMDEMDEGKSVAEASDEDEAFVNALLG